MDLPRQALCAFALLLLLLAGTCTAAQPGPTTMTTTMTMLPLPVPPHGPRHHPHKTAFRHRGSIFSYLPKGSTVPPSGPSPRGNSELNSTPGN
ncbi:hypothetical protein EUGRSUZ_G02364 [Eucalyptus grandis]|uniref:Uncharacterized protein n=2 Tax=Eucalyptus grandis TaxID=71139 RepID=A0ACC3K610_EUCGR|nr:hypothetical protein EUGRSUZ_G02364 [Eucalyptus grandis]